MLMEHINLEEKSKKLKKFSGFVGHKARWRTLWPAKPDLFIYLFIFAINFFFKLPLVISTNKLLLRNYILFLNKFVVIAISLFCLILSRTINHVLIVLIVDEYPHTKRKIIIFVVIYIFN